MVTTKINNNYTTTTNYMLQGIADLGETTQQTQNTPAPVAEPQQEAPKTTKTNKIIKPIINTQFTSYSKNCGYYVPSQKGNIFTHEVHTSTINLYSLTTGFNLTVKVNGVQQVSVFGDDCSADWKLCLVAGDKVEVAVSQMDSDFTGSIVLSVNKDGVTVVSASEGVNHRIKGAHTADIEIKDKYRKQAQQAAVEPTPAQEETTIEAAPVAQIEEETTIEAAQIEEKVLDFGKHAGEAPSALSSGYLKWLVAHESRLLDANRWACTAAKAILEARQAQQEKAA